VSYILSLKFAPRDSLWEFIPKPLPHFEKFLHKVLPEHRDRCVKYLSKKAKARLQNNMIAFNVYIERNGMIIEKNIVDTIIVNSL
jgi:hypothetical protein